MPSAQPGIGKFTQAGQGGGGTGADSVREVLPHVVEATKTLGGGWQTVPYCRCISAARAIAPSIGQAMFEYRYGRRKRADRGAFSTEGLVDLKGYFVRVRKTRGGSEALWTGYVDASDYRVFGSDPVASGVQRFQAYELGHLLNRNEGYGTTIYEPDVVDEVRAIDWIPTLNKRHEDGVQQRGNRSSAKKAIYENGPSVYHFSGEGELWSNYDYLERLLALNTPNSVTFELAGVIDPLKQMHDYVILEGRTAWDIITELISRRRGMGFYLDVKGSKCELVCFTSLDEDLTLGDVEVPKNPNVVNFDPTASIEILEASIIDSSAIVYDEIVALGARCLVCATFGYEDAFEKGWSDAVEDQYKLAANRESVDESFNTPYDDLSLSQKRERNEMVRRHEAYENVFRKHRIKRTWDGTTNGGEPGVDPTGCIPVFDDAGEVSFPEDPPVWAQNKRFESWIPFRQDIDYATPELQDLTPNNTEINYRRPFAFCVEPEGQVPKDEEGELTREPYWFYLHDPLERFGEAQAFMSVDAHDFAIKLQPTHGHVFALNHWGNPIDGVEPSGRYILLDYEKIRATVAFRADTRVRVGLKRKGVKTVARTKVIEVHDAEFWYAHPNTIVDVLDVSPLGVKHTGSLSAADAILRDDRPRLREIAAYALAWYGKPRASVSVSIRNLMKFAELGTMLKSTVQGGRSIPVNTVISSIEYDFTVEGGRTTIRTAWREFDYPDS